MYGMEGLLIPCQNKASSALENESKHTRVNEKKKKKGAGSLELYKHATDQCPTIMASSSASSIPASAKRFSLYT